MEGACFQLEDGGGVEADACCLMGQRPADSQMGQAASTALGVGQLGLGGAAVAKHGPAPSSVSLVSRFK